MNLTELEASDDTVYEHILVYGSPGTGKSLLAGKLAENYKLIWIDLENGYKVLRQLPKEYKDNIEVVRLPDTRTYPIGIETLLKLVKLGKANICELHGKVDCPLCLRDKAAFTKVSLHNSPDTILVIDSGTQLVASCIANITKAADDDYKLQTDDWGNLGKLMDIVMSHIQQAKSHVVVITHECEVAGAGKRDVITPLLGTRNYSRNCAKFFDHVVHTKITNRRHIAYSSSTASSSTHACSRYGIALENLKEPSLLPLFSKEAREAALATKTAVQTTPASLPTKGESAVKSILGNLKNLS